jgi:hypothetical protein
LIQPIRQLDIQQVLEFGEVSGYVLIQVPIQQHLLVL